MPCALNVCGAFHAPYDSLLNSRVRDNDDKAWQAAPCASAIRTAPRRSELARELKMSPPRKARSRRAPSP